MNITIKRIRIRELSTDGQLFIDGLKICDTTEATPYCLPTGMYSIDIFKCPKASRKIPRLIIQPLCDCDKCCQTANERFRIRNKMYSTLEHAIQEGRSDEELRVMEHTLNPEVQDELKKCPEEYCPQIKVGNGIFNTTDGAILVGTYCQPGAVIHSKPTFDALYERIRKSIERGNEVKLIITDSSCS